MFRQFSFPGGFDTAFHATLPPAAAICALPAAWRPRWGVRRFGFHGLSHAWVARRALELLQRSGAEFYVHRLRAAIAAMAASLGGLDVPAFTGGVGERAAEARNLTASGLSFLGVAIDPRRKAERGLRGGAHAPSAAAISGSRMRRLRIRANAVHGPPIERGLPSVVAHASTPSLRRTTV